MLWVCAALALAYVAARRLGLGLDAAVLVAVTFSGSGAVLGAVDLLPSAPDGAAPLFAARNLVGAGVVIAFFALVAMVRRTLEVTPGARDDGVAPGVAIWLPGALGLALAFVGVVALGTARGFAPDARSALVPDPLGTTTHAARAWIAFAGVALAGASALEPRGKLRGKGVVLSLAGVALALTFAAPSLVGARIVAAAGVALLAGDGLEGSRRAMRLAILPVLLIAWIAAVAVGQPGDLAPELRLGAEENELIGFLRRPGDELTDADAEIVGWLFPSARIESARIRVDRVGESGELDRSTPPRFAPLAFVTADELAGISVDAIAATSPGVRWFRGACATSVLAPGHWRFRVEFLTANDDTPVAARIVSTTTVRRGLGVPSHAYAIGALVLVLLLAPGRTRFVSRALVLTAVVQVSLLLRATL